MISAVGLEPEDDRPIRLAEAGGGDDDRVKHRLQLKGRAADDAQNLAGRGLPLERLGQLGGACAHFVEQPGVLDRDHRLIGELLQQLFLSLRHGSSLGPADDDDQYQQGG